MTKWLMFISGGAIVVFGLAIWFAWPLMLWWYLILIESHM